MLTCFNAVLKVNLSFPKHLANIKCYINLKYYYPQNALICRVWSYRLDFFVSFKNFNPLERGGRRKIQPIALRQGSYINKTSNQWGGKWGQFCIGFSFWLWFAWTAWECWGLLGLTCSASAGWHLTAVWHFPTFSLFPCRISCSVLSSVAVGY